MNKNSEEIFLFAGEPSGDLHGSHLAKALKEINKNFNLTGVAGPLMRKEGVNSFMKMEEFAVMGFSDVLLALPSLIKKFYQVVNTILRTDPKAVILIDYPGFNLRVATHLKKKGYQGKIIQFISPTIWAHGKKRIHSMENSLDLLLTIYPFEKKYFEKSSLNVSYIGHPLTEIMDSKDENLSENITNDELIGLFPGSREAEIRRNFSKILTAVALLKKEEPKIVFGISIANEKVKSLIEEMILLSDLKEEDFFFVPSSKTYDLMKNCRTAVAKSGTVTLELALHQKPTVVVYELSFFNRFFAKYMLRLKLSFYCIVNIILGKEVFPELIEKGFTAKNLFKELNELNKEGKKRELCIKDCFHLKKLLLSEDKPTKKAAEKILEVVGS